MIDLFRRAYRLSFGEDRGYYKLIYDMFGFVPYNIDLFKLSLIHKSASIELSDGRQINNERLEYLGDAVIEAITSDYLYIEFPLENEGFLTQLRSKIVSRQSLNRLAKAVGLDREVISLSSGHLQQKHIYGDAFEAIIGAIYLDQGYDVANRLLINRIYANHLDIENLLLSETDFKSRLIEWAQKEHHTIEFKTAFDKNSTPIATLFVSKVIIGGVEVGYGIGESKKEAEQRAARSVSEGVVTDESSDEILDRMDEYSEREGSQDTHSNP